MDHPKGDDPEVFDQAMRDYAGRCNRSIVCNDVFYACIRYIDHPDQCLGVSSLTRSTARWWGKNQPIIPGTEKHVWLTNGPKHTLAKQDRQNIPGFPRSLPGWPEPNGP